MDMSDPTVQSFHAGTIHVTNNMSVLFECMGCDEKFGIYTKFLDHIFGDHLEDWTATGNAKKCRKANKNTNELELEQVVVQKHHAGDLYATTNLCITIECKACEEKFRVHAKFMDHINGKHFTDWIAIGKTKNLPNVNTNTDEQGEYLELEHAVEGVYRSESGFIAEMLQPLKDDTFDGMNGTNDQEPAANASAEESSSYTTVRHNRGRPQKDNLKRKYKCRICGFLVSSFYNLKPHEQRHSVIKSFACIQCDKSFHSSTELNTHIRTHTGDKPYVCTYCGKSYVRSSLLYNHEQRHIGNKRFGCDQCDKRFFNRRELERHYVVHTKARNFRCEECNATFTRKNALNTHKKLHANALEYECNICHMQFNQRPTLLWHIKSKHKVINNGKEDSSLERSSIPITNEYNYT